MDAGSAQRRRAATVTIVLVFTLMISVVSAAAGDYTMESNLNDIADQMERWSLTCGAKPLTPEAQTKLSELLLETSRLLKEIATNDSPDSQANYHQKMAEMKEEWNPFDSRYRN